MKRNEKNSMDSTLSTTVDIPELPIRGIPRTFEMISDREQADFPKKKGEPLAKGLAVALDDAGQCIPYEPGARFAGFLTAQNKTHAAVLVRGSVVLRIDGATDEHRGEPVFCYGPNEFSLDRRAGAAEIGRIRYVQDASRCAVAFAREGDRNPLNLRVDAF